MQGLACIPQIACKLVRAEVAACLKLHLFVLVLVSGSGLYMQKPGSWPPGVWRCAEQLFSCSSARGQHVARGGLSVVHGPLPQEPPEYKERRRSMRTLDGLRCGHSGCYPACTASIATATAGHAGRRWFCVDYANNVCYARLQYPFLLAVRIFGSCSAAWQRVPHFCILELHST